MKERLPEDQREFIHRVDAQNRIVLTNREWRDFAVENRVGHLASDAMQGVSIWRFIHGMETRFIFEVMLAKVRREGRTVTVPFRCDSPDRRRYMEMTLRPQPVGGVEFCHRVIHQEWREVPRLLSGAPVRSEEMMHCCGWCKKVQMRGQQWVEVEEAVAELNLFDAMEMPKITHGACAVCVKKLVCMMEK